MRSNVVDEQSEARKLMLAQMEQKQPEERGNGYLFHRKTKSVIINS